MNLQVEKLEKSMAKLTIEASADDLEKALQSAYKKQKNKIAIPGFRKGKVPRQIIEKMYGAEIFYDDAANELIRKGYAEAYDKCGEEIVSRPEIDIVQIAKGEPFIFTATVALKPEVTLGQYKGLEVGKVPVEVTAEEVEARVREEAEKNARTVTVEDRPVQNGDEVILDYEGFTDGVAFEGGKGENYPLVIGSGSFIPGFEEQLVGAETGADVEVHVTFPQEYHAEALKGKEAVFQCKIHEIKAKEIPEIDDEFASEVSEFETLEEYKEDLKKKLLEQKASEGRKRQEEEAVDQAVKNAQYELPEAMVETQVAQQAEDFERRIKGQGLTMEQYYMITGMTEEQLQKELREQSLRSIEVRLVMEAIVKAENIQVSDGRFDEEVQKMADAYRMDAEKIKKNMGDKEQEQMREDIAVQEAITFLVDNAVEK